MNQDITQNQHLKILHNKDMLALRMFIVWTLGSPDDFGCQHIFHFNILHLFQIWGKK